MTMRTKKTSIADAILFSLIGLLIFAPCLLLMHQDKSGHPTLINLAGLVYAIGLYFLFRAMAKWHDGH